MRVYERVDAWQHCHRLAVAIYRATDAFPKREWYGGLAGQLRSAAYSAAANIAEGAAKKGSKEYRRFLDIAWGSLTELAYGLLLASDLGLMSKADFAQLEEVRAEAARTTWGLYSAVSRDAKRKRVTGNPSARLPVQASRA